jgi:hypothetical protein
MTYIYTCAMEPRHREVSMFTAVDEARAREIVEQFRPNIAGDCTIHYELLECAVDPADPFPYYRKCVISHNDEVCDDRQCPGRDTASLDTVGDVTGPYQYTCEMIVAAHWERATPPFRHTFDAANDEEAKAVAERCRQEVLHSPNVDGIRRETLVAGERIVVSRQQP